MFYIYPENDFQFILSVAFQDIYNYFGGRRSAARQQNKAAVPPGSRHERPSGRREMRLRHRFAGFAVFSGIQQLTKWRRCVIFSTGSSGSGYGEMSEWFKEPVLKTGDSARSRGFESHSLRHFHTDAEVPKRPKGLPC